MVMRTLRKKVSLIIWMSVILLVALVVGLVAPGIMGRKDAAGAAALVNGEPVNAQEFSRALKARLEQARQDQGGELSEAESNKVRRDTLNSLIDEELAFDQAGSLGQTMSPEEFRQELLDDPSLKDQQGRFDQSRYQRILDMQAQQGVPWQEAEANFQRGMLLGKVRGFWACQAVLTPQESAAARARFNRQLKAKAAVWDLEQLRAGAAITDEDLHSYYSENKRKWAKPAQMKLRQILLRADFAASSTTARAKADAVLAKVKGGADFKALAATENADDAARKSSGDLGWVSRDDIRQPQLAAAVSGLKKGETTGVVPTSEGFYILKLEDLKPGFEPTFANSKDKAAKDLGAQRAAKQASLLAHQALAALKAGKSLEDAAKAGQGRIVETGWFGRDDAKALPALGEDQAFARQLLTLDKGAWTEEPVSSAKAVAVALVSDERPGAPPAKPEDAESRDRAALEEARSAKARSLYEAWLAGLHKRAEIADQSGLLAEK